MRIKCRQCGHRTTSDVFGVAAMKAHVVRCEAGMATDTDHIPVIEGTPVCSRCHIRLSAVPEEPVVTLDGTYHQVCAALVEEDTQWAASSPSSSPAWQSDTEPLRVR